MEHPILFISLLLEAIGLPVPHTLVVELSNDAIGYLPTQESFRQGGYETTTGSTFYEPGTAERIVASALTQLEQLFQRTEDMTG